MSTGNHVIDSKIRRFLRKPIPEKLHAIRLIFNRLKSTLYYRRIFGSFGRGTVIFNPKHISNAHLMNIGNRTSIGQSAHIELISEYAGTSYSPAIEIGNDVYIGPNLYMVCIGKITIGDGSVLSEHVFVHDSNHGFEPEGGLIMQQPLVHGGNIAIGKNCFLGFRTAIMPGVTLGDHCVVATGSVVTKSFPAYSMLAGVPAVLIKRYSFSEKRWTKDK
jgi:acetyltransferase-like isoleucine patch superfamily enzyme